MQEIVSSGAVRLTAAIVSAYVSNNALPTGDLTALISTVHETVARLRGHRLVAAVAEAPRPAVPIKKSVSETYIVCLEDGRKLKSLKRHLRTRYNLSPEQYRAKWQLSPDYPMVAPGYAELRSQMAKDMGLGQRRRGRGKAK